MRTRALLGFVTSLSLSLISARAAAQTPPPAKSTAVEISSLRLMREKNLITEQEYASALKDIGASVGSVAGDAPALVLGKWSASLYGFIEGDAMLDSTQSFGDVAGNAQVKRKESKFAPPPNTFAGDHGRLQVSVRNSRFGIRMRAPEVAHVRASATLEMDFLGTDPSIDPSTAGSGAVSYPLGSGASEASFWNNPTMRMRLGYFKVENPIVDILFGQYWHLFGWQPAYQPNSVQIQGLPGELYARTLQLRISKNVPIGPTSLEFALAALRPPQRDSMTPEITGGIKFDLGQWKGLTTRGSTSRDLQPLSFAITGTMRNFVAPSFVQQPTTTISRSTAALAVVAFVPIIPASKGHEGNSLTATSQIVMGGGIADMFTGMTGGIAFPTLANKSKETPTPIYPQNVENGSVVFDTCSAGPNDPGSSCKELHPIQWNVFMVGLQYYLPGLHGRVWVSGNYAHIESPNIANYTRRATTAPVATDDNYVNAANVRQAEDFFNACLFVDPLESVRVGIEYAHYDDKYVDGVHAIHHRGQLSGFFLF